MQPDQSVEPPANSSSLEPRKRSNIVYISGGNREDPKNRHPAMLEYGADNHIRMYADGALVFDCTPEAVKDFSITIGAGYLKLKDGGYFHLDFSGSPDGKLPKGPFYMSGPLKSLFTTVIDRQALRYQPNPDLDWWAHAFVHGADKV